MADCIFCKIGTGEIKSDILFRDDLAFAIRDIHPRAPTHILVIPHEHLPAVSDLSAKHEGLMGHLVDIANRLAQREGLSSRGYRLVVNCGGDAGQAVLHLHLHLLGGRALGAMG